MCALTLDPQLTRNTLKTILEKKYKNEKLKLKNWNITQLQGGLGQGTAIYRITGDKENETTDWSLILKTLQPESGNKKVSDWNYYRREADAYQSGFFKTLESKIKAPQCYTVTNYTDGKSWIWLEDIQDYYEGNWSFNHYKTAARHLGQFNGTYLDYKKRPQYEWLSKNWIRDNIERSKSAIKTLEKHQNNPLMKLMFPDKLMENTFTLWKEREKYIEALEKLPKTICHHDAFRRNLFARKNFGDEFETVLIDWAFVGIGPIGADLTPFIRASVSFREVDFENIEKFEALALEGYMNGLDEVGWNGDYNEVFLGYSLSNLRYTLGSLTEIVNNVLFQANSVRADAAFGNTVKERMIHFGKVRKYYNHLEQDARKIIENSNR